jgi:hypothetical protein
MGLLKGLFKRKEGGTFFGNVIRGVGDKFTGGMMSVVNPAPIGLNQSSQPNAQLQNTAYQSGGLLGSLVNAQTNNSLPDTFESAKKEGTKALVMYYLKAYWYILAIPVIYLTYMLIKKYGKTKPKRRY